MARPTNPQKINDIHAKQIKREICFLTTQITNLEFIEINNLPNDLNALDDIRQNKKRIFEDMKSNINKKGS